MRCMSSTVRRWAMLAGLLVPAICAADETLSALLESGALKQTVNPVPINFLLNEGKGKLDGAQSEQALDQLTAALRVQTSPLVALLSGMNAMMNTPTQQQMAQQQPSKTTMGAALLLAMAGGPNLTQQTAPSAQQVEQMQQETKQAMADPWVRGIAAADAYVAMGDAQSAGRFYVNCIAMPMGIDWLAESCLDAALRLGPARAYVLLSWMVAHPEQAAPSAGAGMMVTSLAPRPDDPSVVQARRYGLEGLGQLIGDGALDATQAQTAFATLLAYADGKQNAPFYEGAALALGRSKDPRAVAPLRRLAKQAGKDVALHDAALRSLALGFADPQAVAELRKLLNDKEEARRFRAAEPLFRIGDPVAFDWAIAAVTASRAAEDTAPDIRARVTRDLLEQGGDAGKRALSEIHRRGAGNDWLQAWVAIAMLQGGDQSELGEVRAALAKTGWTLDRVGVRAWWGRVSPFLQLALQFSLTGTINTQAAVNIIGNLVASERGRYAQHSNLEEMLLAQLQWQAADAFAASGSDDTVPDLTRMLGDARDVVRMSAARALAVHPGAHAIDGYATALSTDFGEEEGVPRAPEVRGALLRAALIRYPNDPRTAALCSTAAHDADAGVRFIALTALSPHPA
jgi:HEAT repeat protein